MPDSGMIPVADPVIAKGKDRAPVEVEVDALRELLRLSVASVREVMKERDDRYRERFDAQEKAVIKSEAAQQAYNDRSNEFRAALDDQGKSMITRAEADQRFGQMHELFDAQAKLISALQLTISRGEGKQAVVDPAMTELATEMKLVRHAQSAGTGKSEGSHAMWGYVVGAIGLIGLIIGIVMMFVKK